LGEWDEIRNGKVIWTFVQMRIKDKDRMVLKCIKRDLYLELTKDSVKVGNSFNEINGKIYRGSWHHDEIVPESKKIWQN